PPAAGPARASRTAGIDASGPWAVTLTTSPPIGPISCSLFITQAGSALSASTRCPDGWPSLHTTGTIASTTAAVTPGGIESSCCGNTITVPGTVAPDARTFTAVAECPVAVFPYPVDIAGSRCGNGVLDPGEMCDDGNQLNGDCCSATCDSAAPEGTSC